MNVAARRAPPPLAALPPLAFLLLLVGLPFASKAGLPLGAAAISACALALVLPSLVHAARGGGPARFSAWPEAVAFLLFSAGAVVSTLHADSLAPRGMPARLPLYLAFGAFFFALASLLRGPLGKDVERPLRRVLLLAIVAHAFVAYFRFFVRAEPRLSGFAFNPNFFAALLSAGWFVFESTARAAARTRVLLAAAVGLTVLLTGSRAGMVAFALAALLALFHRFAQGGRVASRRVLSAAAVVLAVLGALALLTDNPLSRRLGAGSHDKSFPRTFVWRVAAENLAKEPLGVGPGQNRHAFARRAEYAAEPGLLHRRHEIGLAHNVVLGAGVELGVLGMAGFLLFSATPLVRHARARDALRQARARGGPDAAAAARARGSFGAFLLLFAQSQVDGLMQSPVMVASFLYFAADHGAAIAALPAAAAVASGRRRPWLEGLVAATACCVLLVEIAPLRAARLLREGDALRAAGDLGGAILAYERADRTSARDPGAAAGVVACLAQRATLSREPAILPALGAALERAAARAPADPRPWQDAAGATLKTAYARGEPDARLLALALAAFQQALERDPLDVEARYRVAALKALLQDPHGAKLAYLDLLRLEPNHVVARVALADLLEREGDPEAAIAELRGALDAYEACVAITREQRFGERAFYRGLVEKFDRRRVEERIAWLSGEQGR